MNSMKIIDLIKSKINCAKTADQCRGFTWSKSDYVDSDWVIKELIKCQGNCVNCHCKLKLNNWELRDPEQFTIDRIDNKYPHLINNCQIFCWGCNYKKGGRDMIKDQSFKSDISYKYDEIQRIGKIEADKMKKKMKEFILSADEHKKISKYLFTQCLRKKMSNENCMIFYDYYLFDPEIFLNLLAEWQTHTNDSYLKIYDHGKLQCIKEILSWFGLKHSNDILNRISLEDFEKGSRLFFSNIEKVMSVFSLKVSTQDSDIYDSQKVFKIINSILKKWSHVKLFKKRCRRRDKGNFIDLPPIYMLELLSRDDLIIPNEISLLEILKECEDLDLLVSILLNPPKKIQIKLKNV